jgi:hypothetical protein
MDAAKDLSIGFHAVADHPALAVRANRRERVDCALKAVEGVMLASDDDLKRLVIIIFANFASSHTKTVRASSPLRRYSFFFCEQEVCDEGRFPGALVYRGSCQLPLHLYRFSEVEIARESDSFHWSRSWKYQNSLSIV